MITGDVNVRLSVSGAVQLPKASAACGLTEEVKQALLTVARKVAYIDENGQTYYDALYNALYPPAVLLSINAIFTQGSAVIYDSDSLDVLRQYLTVTGLFDDYTTETIQGYSLSGTLTAGTSTITVSYGGKTTTFGVEVTHRVWAVTSIDAVFTQGSAVIYDNDPLDVLREYLVVTATYENESTAVVTSYSLSGTLTVGTSTITVSFGGKTDTLTVTVTQHVAVLTSITAVFTQGQNVVYDTDSLDALKQYLVVTAHYDDNTDVVVNDYTLSGTLAEGTSTITVSFGGKTTTFNVAVSDYDRYNYSLTNEQLVKINASISGFVSGQTYYGNIGIAYKNSGKRRGFPTKLPAPKPMIDEADGTDTEFYPIPIPTDTVKAVVSIEPATQFHGVSIYTYSDGKYIRQQDPGWKQGAFTYTFTAGQYDYITVASKYNSAGTSYPEEPTAVSIQFLTE